MSSRELRKIRATQAMKKAKPVWWASLIAIILVLTIEKWLSFTNQSNWTIIITGIAGSILSYLLVYFRHYAETGDPSPPIPWLTIEKIKQADDILADLDDDLSLFVVGNFRKTGTVEEQVGYYRMVLDISHRKVVNARLALGIHREER